MECFDAITGTDKLLEIIGSMRDADRLLDRIESYLVPGTKVLLGKYVVEVTDKEICIGERGARNAWDLYRSRVF